MIWIKETFDFINPRLFLAYTPQFVAMDIII